MSITSSAPCHSQATFFGVLCALFVLLMSPVQPALADTPALRVVMEQGKAQAATLEKEGKNDEAYALYTRLLRENPGDDAVDLGLVRTARATERIPQAIMALERLVDRHPTEAGLRVELARLYVRVGDSQSARLEMAAARRYNPNISVETAEGVVDTLQEQASPWQFAGRLSLGVMYDSNVNSGLAVRDITIGGLSLRMDDAATNQEAWGEYTNASLNGAYRLGQDSAWWLVGDVNAYVKAYNNSVPSNQNFLWGRFGFGLRHFSADTLFDARLKLEQAIYDPHQEMTVFGPELTFAYSVTDWFQSISRGGIEHRQYLFSNGRNGTYWWIGQYGRFLINQGDGKRHELTAGLRYLGGDADTSEYDFDGWEASLRLVLHLPYSFELAPFISWREESYKGAATLLESRLGSEKREDQSLQTGTFLTYRWSERFSNEVGYQYVKNLSNSPLYKYDQHVVSFGTTWTF